MNLFNCIIVVATFSNIFDRRCLIIVLKDVLLNQQLYNEASLRCFINIKKQLSSLLMKALKKYIFEIETMISRFISCIISVLEIKI